MTLWMESWRCDPEARAIADRHYNRQTVGAQDFMPPGRCLVLYALGGGAVWGTAWPFAEYVKHEWAGAWVNSLFRREHGPQASDLIRSAVAATLAKWGPAPDLGMVTFIDRTKIRHKRDPGRCYLRAGFEVVGETAGGLLALGLRPENMPDPDPAAVRQGRLFEASA